MAENTQAGCFKFVAYYRVSTGKQQDSGLGIEAQRACVMKCIPEGGTLVAELQETASGRSTSRPKLDEALKLCKEQGACLIIAKLDRLARDVEYLFRIMKSGVKVQACDLPEFNTLTLGIFASFAQYEAERISDRTKSALDAKKERGDKEWRVGGFTPEERAKSRTARREARAQDKTHQRALNFILLLRKDGFTWRDIATKCNESGFTTSNGSEMREGTAHRFVKYHFEDYVWAKWNATKEGNADPFRKVSEMPARFVSDVSEKYAEAYGLDATYKFKSLTTAREILIHRTKLASLKK